MMKCPFESKLKSEMAKAENNLLRKRDTLEIMKCKGFSNLVKLNRDFLFGGRIRRFHFGIVNIEPSFENFDVLFQSRRSGCLGSN
jgi:hypothetical protein